jgi:peptide-methionine (S)-S-oxide reductase
MAIATFGAGCFWGVEKAFSNLDGVLSTRVGYQGGHTKSPTYEEVCADTTGHAEVVKIEFNENLISYGELLNTFWNCHNPTTLNQQGLDKGSQYRSIIFADNKMQKEMSEKSIENINTSGRFQGPIVTIIEMGGDFYQAEEHHQKYFEKNDIEACAI